MNCVKSEKEKELKSAQNVRETSLNEREKYQNRMAITKVTNSNWIFGKREKHNNKERKNISNISILFPFKWLVVLYCIHERDISMYSMSKKFVVIDYYFEKLMRPQESFPC
ncbi:hypothetical protein ACKWTF_009990 [Chironomus riparius]